MLTLAQYDELFEVINNENLLNFYELVEYTRKNNEELENLLIYNDVTNVLLPYFEGRKETIAFDDIEKVRSEEYILEAKDMLQKAVDDFHAFNQSFNKEDSVSEEEETPEKPDVSLLKEDREAYIQRLKEYRANSEPEEKNESETDSVKEYNQESEEEDFVKLDKNFTEDRSEEKFLDDDEADITDEDLARLNDMLHQQPSQSTWSAENEKKLQDLLQKSQE